MGYHKGHKEFHVLDLQDGWHTLPGYPLGIQEKIIAGKLDEKNKRGNRTRLLRLVVSLVPGRCGGHRLVPVSCMAAGFFGWVRAGSAGSSPSAET